MLVIVTSVVSCVQQSPQGQRQALTQERLHVCGVATAVPRGSVAAHGDPGARVVEAVDAAGALENRAADLGGRPPDDLKTSTVRGGSMFRLLQAFKAEVLPSCSRSSTVHCWRRCIDMECYTWSALQ